jgi:hypothetical protein
VTRPKYIAEADTIALPLFQQNPTPAYRKDRDTSVEAAAKVRDNAASIRARVLEEIRQAGQRGVTVSELMDALHIDERNNVAPRCSELGRHSMEIVWIAGSSR